MIQQRLKELLLQENYTAAIEVSEALHPADVAETLALMPLAAQVRFIESLGAERAAFVLQQMELANQAEIIDKLGLEKATEILTVMSTDDVADLLGEFPGEVRGKLLAAMGAVGQEIKQLLNYDEDTSGGLMATEFIAIQEGQTVEQVLALLRRLAPSEKNAYYIYVVDDDQTLTGVVSLRELVISPLDTKIETIAKREVISVPENLDQEEVARIFEKYDFLALPVVNQENKIVGVITVDDVLDVAEEEATEDILKGASINPLDEGYDSTSVWTLFSKRIVWLVILIFVNLISSGIIAAYEDVLSSALALAFFIPLLIGTGGNTGSQSATLVIRALVTGDVEMMDWGKVFLKELLVGACLGTVLGAAGAVLGLFRGGIEIGLVVGLTMMAIVVVSNLIGMILPFGLTLLRLDPAVASSPLITTISDATGLLIYFAIASLILNL